MCSAESKLYEGQKVENKYTRMAFDWIYISALTFALGIFHVSLIICTSADVSSEMGGVGTSPPLLEDDESFWRKLPMVKKSHDCCLLRSDEEWTHVRNGRGASYRESVNIRRAPWLDFTNTIRRREQLREKSIRWLGITVHIAHILCLTSPNIFFLYFRITFEKKLNHRAERRIGPRVTPIQPFYDALVVQS